MKLTDFAKLVLYNDAVQSGEFSRDAMPTLALYLSGTVFSAIHLGARHWEFPSPLIQTLWRWFAVAAVAASSMPFVQRAYIHTYDRLFDFSDCRHGDLLDKWAGWVMYRLWIITAFGMILCYAVSRLVIVFLAFYCFYSMPASAYEKLEWADLIPHFS